MFYLAPTFLNWYGARTSKVGVPKTFNILQAYVLQNKINEFVQSKKCHLNLVIECSVMAIVFLKNENVGVFRIVGFVYIFVFYSFVIYYFLNVHLLVVFIF